MKGIDLKTYKRRPRKIRGDNESHIKDVGRKLSPYIERIKLRSESPRLFKVERDIENHLDILRIEMFKNFTFNELCRIYYFKYFLHSTVINFFERHYQYEIIHKLKSSIWFYGHSADWNTLVEAYYSIRRFNLGLKDFIVRLDYVKGNNRRDNSKFSKTYLDGVFAFLVHHKKKHVMTISFSVGANKKVFINQIQMVNKKGNRFLFKMPENIVEFVIRCFFKHFKGFDVYFVDGRSLADVILELKKKSPFAYGISEAQKKARLKEYIEFVRFGYMHVVKVYSYDLISFQRSRKGKWFGDLLFYKIERCKIRKKKEM